jgi:hypothetical protein
MDLSRDTFDPVHELWVIRGLFAVCEIYDHPVNG